MKTATKTNLTEDQMLQFSAAGKCASKAVQNTLLALCAIGSIFNPGVAVAGMAYYAYCHND
jgi:hypothetical protein